MSSLLGGGETQFVPWRSLPNVQERFELTELREDVDGLFITLQSESERSLRIDVASPLAYRSQLRSLDDTAWARFDESGGSLWQAPADGERLHYLVLTSSCAVEFLTDQVPHISWLDNFFGDAV